MGVGAAVRGQFGDFNGFAFSACVFAQPKPWGDCLKIVGLPQTCTPHDGLIDASKHESVKAAMAKSGTEGRNRIM